MAPSFTQWDDGEAAPNAATLLLGHERRTKRVVVLLHGLTSSPPQFAAVARSLHERGHTVFVPRLPRHGYPNRLTDALLELEAGELLEFGDRALAFARDLGDEVVVCGFSLGGLLAFALAHHEPLHRAVAVAPFLAPKLVPHAWRGALIRYIRSRPNRFFWWNVIRRERQQPEHGYPRYPTHAIAHILQIADDLVEAARTSAPRTNDVCVLLNASETAVSNRAADALVQLWRRYPGVQVDLHHLRGLPFGHDIVEPLRDARTAARVLPAIVEAIDE